MGRLQEILQVNIFKPRRAGVPLLPDGTATNPVTSESDPLHNRLIKELSSLQADIGAITSAASPPRQDQDPTIAFGTLPNGTVAQVRYTPRDRRGSLSVLTMQRREPSSPDLIRAVELAASGSGTFQLIYEGRLRALRTAYQAEDFLQGAYTSKEIDKAMEAGRYTTTRLVWDEHELWAFHNGLGLGYPPITRGGTTYPYDPSHLAFALEAITSTRQTLAALTPTGNK